MLAQHGKMSGCECGDADTAKAWQFQNQGALGGMRNQDDLMHALLQPFWAILDSPVARPPLGPAPPPSPFFVSSFRFRRGSIVS